MHVFTAHHSLHCIVVTNFELSRSNQLSKKQQSLVVLLYALDDMIIAVALTSKETHENSHIELIIDTHCMLIHCNLSVGEFIDIFHPP